MERLSPTRQRKCWNVLLRSELKDDYLITPLEGEKAAEWSKALIEEGVAIFEMNRKIPVLEDLFLQLTGGGTIE